jgi:hypothetical protein
MMTARTARTAARKAERAPAPVPRRAGGALAVLLLVLPLLAGCAGDPFAEYAPLDHAVQHPHPRSVPQVARDGTVLQAYDPARSFFPLALSGALVDYGRGAPGRGFNAALMADFNAVTADPDQPLEAQLAAADASRLLLLRARPSDNWGELRHGALLDATDITVIAMPRGPKGPGAAGRDAFARSLRQQQDSARPVWALLPASARTGNGEMLPDPAEAQAMAFAAIMAGATGLIWHGEDNYAARNAGMLGMAPAPQLDYGIQIASGLPALKATPDDAAAARRLWDTVTQLNRRIARIVPALLQADAAAAYTVAARIERAPRATPPRVQSLLKPYDGGLLLILLNDGERAEELRIGFSRAIRSLNRTDSAEPVQADPARGLFRDTLPARGLRLYRIVLM